ncbi:MAG: amidohydrolase family protein [Woeseiaceae bacterium]|nr:amidohydrolase family protein [Woeseiaceae bacterium]
MTMDLLGDLWVVPADGGDAESLVKGRKLVKRPRWSPDASSIVYQANVDGRDELHLFDLATGTDRVLSNGRWADRHPDWHPDGERIVFSSARRDSGFDLWEIDVPTGLAWRLTRKPGNETEPSWSADGRSLVYVHEHDGQWSIMLRRHGRADEMLVSSESRLASPSWRPDGSLVTYLRQSEGRWLVSMTILSNPPLDRPMLDGEDFFLAPVAWRDRQQLLYTANGELRTRDFNSWTSSSIPFRADVGSQSRIEPAAAVVRELEPIDEPGGRHVIRVARLYDGIDARYRQDTDIVVEGGRIASVGDHADHDDAILVDLGDLTAIPGLIDAQARLPDDFGPGSGPLLLSAGLTTVVVPPGSAADLNARWSGKALPGPRVVEHDWKEALESGTAAYLGERSARRSPAGRSYQDVLFAGGSATTTWLSGLADGSTPTLDRIWQSRQVRAMSAPVSLANRFTATPDLSAVATSLVLASKPNGLPAGIGVHAELRALVAAGLTEEQALKAAGVNAANALGFGYRIGRIAPGSAADLLIVDGDPLADIGDALNIVGVVRNGRFFSVSGLLERVPAAASVE